MRRHLPKRWLFTDERLRGSDAGDPLWTAIRRLPFRAGIVFRHYGWPEAARRQLLGRILLVARHRLLVVVSSGMRGAGHGVHRPAGTRAPRLGGLLTAAAHDERQVRRAFRQRADLVFLSPVFATASHPGARTLGPRRFGRIARRAAGPVVALGGMDRRRARLLGRLGAFGYAGIGCWVGRQGKPDPSAGPASLAPPRRRL